MDPIANMKEQLTLARKFIRLSEDALMPVAYEEADVVRLSELVIALDQWQRNGGFSPYGIIAALTEYCHEHGPVRPNMYRGVARCPKCGHATSTTPEEASRFYEQEREDQ